MSAQHIRRILVLCASLALFAFATPSHSFQEFWNNPAGGPFNLNTNWSLGIVPGPADQAYFNLGSASTYTVIFPGNVTNNQLTIDQNNVTFDLGGAHQY